MPSAVAPRAQRYWTPTSKILHSLKGEARIRQTFINKQTIISNCSDRFWQPATVTDCHLLISISKSLFTLKENKARTWGSKPSRGHHSRCQTRRQRLNYCCFATLSPATTSILRTSPQSRCYQQSIKPLCDTITSLFIELVSTTTSLFRLSGPLYLFVLPDCH